MTNQGNTTIMPRLKMLNMHVSIGKYLDFNDAIMAIAQGRRSNYICVANVHMLVEANRNVHFADIVNGAEIVTPDGKPLTWALNLLHGMKQERVAGMDLLPDLIRSAEEMSVPVFFYGGTPMLLAATEKFLHGNYGELKIAGMYSPPFRDLTMHEEIEIADRINRSGARLVFVVLGCPKQEKWMGRMKGRIHATMIGVGGALPVFIGEQKRAPIWMQKNGLEWFYRMSREPRRLFKRYAITNSIFCWMLLKAWLDQRFKVGKSQEGPARKIAIEHHLIDKE